ncbi:MAG: hypothetical protein LBT53_04770 [Puniceicoccales bacterium]|nr:hypothetical protein [Puniceicoccales bacterium]
MERSFKRGREVPREVPCDVPRKKNTNGDADANICAAAAVATPSNCRTLVQRFGS